MKKLTLLMALAFPCALHAQDDAYGTQKKTDIKSNSENVALLFPTKDGKIVYEKVIDFTGRKKENLYAASNKWISDTFRSAKSVIESSDITTGQIVGWAYGILPPENENALISFSSKYKFNLQINCKDDKVRIRFYNINIHSDGGMGVAEMNVPLDNNIPAKELSVKKKEKLTAGANRISKYFYGLIDSFASSVKTSNNDEF